MTMLDWIKDELQRVKKDDFYGGLTEKAVLELAEVFLEQGHSGASAILVGNTFHRLLVQGKPLSPLTGEESEWVDHTDISNEPLFQNKRCHSVFKTCEGSYYLDGYVFREFNEQAVFTCRESRVDIEFPWMPPERSILIQLNEGESPAEGRKRYEQSL